MTDPKNPHAEVTRHYALGESAHKLGRLEEARQHYVAALQLDPEHTDALHSLGSIDAALGEFDDAERLVRKAIAINPMQAGFLNTLGNILRARKQYPEAAAVYRQALQLQPGLAVAHNSLGMVFKEQGNHEQAIECYFKALELDPENAAVYNNLGKVLNNRRKFDEAADAFLRALTIRPRFSEVHNNLGHVYRAQDKLDKAEDCFRNAISCDAKLVGAYHNLGTILMMKGQPLDATDAFSTAARLNPGDLASKLNEGISLHTAGKLQAAVVAYQAVLKRDAGHSEAWLALGLVFNELRQSEEARHALEKAIACDPESTRAYAELAALHEDLNELDEGLAVAMKGLAIDPRDPRINLEIAKFDRREGDIAKAIDRLERFDLSAMDHRLGQQFSYELGLGKDRAGEFEQAFALFEAANRHGRMNERLHQVDAQRYLKKIDDLHAFFEREDVGTWPVAEPDDPASAPVFLFGFPRSGTTLTDLLLDGHPMIRTLEEKPTINAVEMAIASDQPGYPEKLKSLESGDLAKLRQIYFTEVDRHVGRDKNMIIVDKLPIRTVHAGLIWRLFPDSKIVFSARHPCDVCLSCFMQQFNSNDAFANFFSLEDTVNIYDKVMRLWRTYVGRLDLNIHMLRYEDLVGDLEHEAKKLLRFLGVDWQPGVLDFNEKAKQRGRIATNSYHQVTEPLYQRAVGRWLSYADKLEPFMAILEPHIHYFGYKDS
ncbi:MAG: sulfotransferase family protein [Gammaproteobacteria bacterium]|nr:MAG: sulfotransferase family protein [Gammaproteobacteria bacterium]